LSWRATEISVGKIAGAVGTYANLIRRSRRAHSASLGLRPEVVPTQIVARDRHAGYFQALARLGTAVERIALTVRHWQRTEVGEASEAFRQRPKGLVGHAAQEESDPVREPVWTGPPAARLWRVAALEDVALWHERDISHSSVERVIGPTPPVSRTSWFAGRLGWSTGLVVYPERMRRNLDHTGGLYFSEGVMLALVRTGLARQAAYELVQKHALARRPNWAEDKPVAQFPCAPGRRSKTSPSG
jgi:adenylosuccinate lyase